MDSNEPKSQENPTSNNDNNSSNITRSYDNIQTTTSGKQRPTFKSKKTDSFVNKNANSDQLDLSTLTHEQLLVEAKRLQNHLSQLKNIINKKSDLNSSASTTNKTTDGDESTDNKAGKKKKTHVDRPFDFSKFNKRHVFVKFAYLGWDYQGYTVQEGTTQTIEHHLFEAFLRTKLIQSRETSNYHRCGRTDKGVSAFSQVVSIDLRSNCASGEGVIVNPDATVKNTEIENEINYVKLLNGVLPDEIRAISWSPVSSDMSARFDCVERVYRYFLPKGDLDIDLMRDAGKRLVGEKDFRNFCKMDVSNGVVTFLRRIDNITVNCLDKEPHIYSMLEIIVEGSSFLWHQIRCIVAILILVGQKREAPSIIDDLLDIEKYPSKPQYTMSSELPLCLFECEFPIEKVKWRYDAHELSKCVRHLQEKWLESATRSSIIKRMIDSLEEKITAANEEGSKSTGNWRIDQPYSSLQGKSQPHAYVKFEDRQRADTLEQRVDHYVKKRRLNPDVYEKINEANDLAKSLNIYKPNNSSN